MASAVVITEAWKSVIGHTGLYEVSNQGRVRSLHARHSTPRILKPFPSSVKDPHLKVTLCDGLGGKRSYYVHVLVAEAFIGPRPEGQEVRHMDGDPANNWAFNLRWGTRSENIKDSVAHGTHWYAAKTECPAGHAYTPENTYVTPGTQKRRCRACRKVQNTAAMRRYRARKRVAA